MKPVYLNLICSSSTEKQTKTKVTQSGTRNSEWFLLPYIRYHKGFELVICGQTFS